nr:immunoglobulin light chain junction region [Macaca mulatta]MOX81328.1 immunoglobulin light chain junction region [Macaca mulatta]MOX82226.1 immunoglobulin light chain junction region [Macaca mulatta]MOX83370.1 immunoglobulin light chain junction region [Macaca mulatta]MOX83677.1 immunoglobulin light chain junction region [Macaca mulatta]
DYYCAIWHINVGLF